MRAVYFVSRSVSSYTRPHKPHPYAPYRTPLSEGNFELSILEFLLNNTLSLAFLCLLLLAGVCVSGSVVPDSQPEITARYSCREILKTPVAMAGQLMGEALHALLREYQP